MTLFELGALGEFVGAIGVVLTLIYLAVQIRQNTKSVQSAAEFDVLNAWNALHNLRASDGELNEILTKGWRGKELSFSERNRFNSLCYSQFNIYHAIYYQHESGVLRQELWEAFNEGLAAILEFETMKSWIDENRLGFGRSFLNYVDALIKERSHSS